MESSSCKVNNVVGFADFPLYTVCALNDRYICVGGGGGPSKTGIRNGFQIFELLFNGTTCKAKEVLFHDTGSKSVMNSMAFDNGKHFVYAAGLDADTSLYQLTFQRRKEEEEEPLPSGSDLPPGSSSLHYRKRRHSSNRSNTSGSRRSSSSSQPARDVFTELLIEVNPVQSFQTDFQTKDPKEMPFQKVICVSPCHSYLVTGGVDSTLKLWSYPSLSKIREMTGHKREIDDVDFTPKSDQIVSISKDGHGYIWNVKDGKILCDLKWSPPNGTKYMYKKCRFGIVEGNPANIRLYTLHNPIASKKHPSYIVKWETKTYTPEKQVPVKDSFSALGVSRDGTYLAVGYMFTGRVDIYTSFNLQVVYTASHPHSSFVTGLSFLPQIQEPSGIVACSDTAVVSISVDKQIKLHRLLKRKTLPFWLVTILAVIVLMSTFVFCSWLGI